MSACAKPVRDGRDPSHRKVGWVLAVLLYWASGTTVAGDADPGVAKEYELKAAYLFNFAKFVRWPATALPDADTPLVVGIFGSDRVAVALDALTKGRSVNGHPVQVKVMSDATNVAGLRVLYLDRAEDAGLSQIAPVFSSNGLLTVGESEAFAQAGGMIRLVVEANRLQFEINAGAAQRAGLSLSSQLLTLARKVQR